MDLVRHALRRLRRSPGYSLPVLISLALGIGLNTAVFAVMDDVIRRPLPYPDESRLLAIGSLSFRPASDSAPRPSWFVFFRDVAVWRQGTKTLESFARFDPYHAVIAGPIGAESVEG